MAFSPDLPEEKSMKQETDQSSNEASSALNEHIRQVENGMPSLFMGGNEPPLQLTLQKLMDLYKVPGLSLAVIDDFKIAWSKGYGVTEAGGTTPVTPRTLFQSGSVSKPVAAAGALYLVGQGELSLDEDINQKLSSWKVPDNEFTRKEKVTLRRILSHCAGFTVHFFPGYAVNEPVPSLVQILDGETPANTAPIRVDFVPGSKWRYSGGGTIVCQQLIIDITGRPFPEFMQDVVFDRMGMTDSTFEQPLPAARAVQAASGTFWDGNMVPGKWHVYPEMAAGGLWSTPTDLARYAIEIALSNQGRSNRVLSQAIAQEMVRPQMERVGEIALGNEEYVDRMGLGFFLGDETRPDLFGHIGDDAGFQAMLFMFGDTGQGVAFMANSDLGILIGDCLVENIAKEYAWKNFIPSHRPRIAPSAVLLTIANEKGTQAAIQKYEDLKKADLPRFMPDQNTLLLLSYSQLLANNLQDALEIMRLEVQEYPDYWNAYDSLAEMYLQAGDKQLAIRNYEKSIDLNPDNRNGIEKLNQLKHP
jgi:CubicO group peptidase (beta-lactamase class C family)